MNSMDDWSPPSSPSIIAAMEVDVIPETCPSEIEGDKITSPDDLDSALYPGEQVLDDLPMCSTQIDSNNEFQIESLDEIHTIQDSILIDEQAKKSEVFEPIPFCCRRYKTESSERMTACNRFLHNPGSVLSSNNDITEILSTVSVYEILPETMDNMFYRMKQIISKISHGNLDSDTDYLCNREKIVVFYTYLKSYLYRLPQNLDEGEDISVKKLVTLLHSTVMYTDRLSELRYDNTLTTSLCEYNRFHLNLDLYWHTLEILYLLDFKYTDIFPLKKISTSYSSDEGESRSLLLQMIQVVLWELVSISIFKFQKKSNLDLMHSSPFDCNCVRDIWKLVASILNQKGECFWINIHEIMQILLDGDHKVPEDMELDSDVYMYPPLEASPNDNSKFCMWMLTNIALLLNNTDNKVITTSNYYDLNALIKKTINKADLSEVDLRFYLKSCQQLCNVWEPNITLLVTFWDYFYKRMNSTFQLKTISVDSLQTVSKTAVDLLERCKQYSNGQSHLKQNETSYQLYLGLLGNHLRRLVETSSMQEWKQMKGRIYSKFHQRRIQELTETGLNNFTSLFLCLALTADLEDVSTKLSGFYDMVEVSRQNVAKLIMTWKGMFALMLLHLQRNLDIKFIAEKLSTAFCNICIEFEVFESDPGYRHSMWKLINVYLDGTQEIFDVSSDFSLSQHLLIAEGYTKLLKTCRNNEVPVVITGLQDVISKIRMLHNSRKKDLYHSGSEPAIYQDIFSHIYPAVKDLCQSQTAQVHLADILAEISLLAIDCKPDDYFTIMKFMLHTENINKNIVCRYLSHIVTVDSALELLTGHMTKYQTVLIQTWIRCATFVPSSSHQLQALNRSMINLPDIQNILKKADYVISDEPDKIIFHVFKAIQNLYDRLENWKEKIELRDQVIEYTKDIHRHLAPYLQTLRPVETLSTAFSVIGYLVKCCSHLLYVKSKPNCPLPDIINTMIVPHTLFKKDKPVSPVFLGLVRDHLHLFVSGLANLDFKRDPFIQRRLKDIVTIYLTKFWNSAGSTSSAVHPLVMSLKGSYLRQPVEISVAFRQYVMELVKENFMMVSATYNLPEHYQMALFFLRDVINRTVNKEVLASDLCILVCPFLILHLQCDSISTQQLCQGLLQQLVDAGSANLNMASKDAVGEEITTFVSKFKKVKLNQAIKTLEKLPKSGSCYVQKILPRIEYIIVEYESFRGTGQNTRLRQTYHSLIQTFHSGKQSGEK